MTNPRRKQLILLACSCLLLVVLATWVEWAPLLETLRNARPGPLLAAALLTITFPLLNTLRWLSVLRGLGIGIPPWKAFRVTMACWPLGTITPAKTGELLKAAAVKDRTLGLGSVVAERIVDVAVLGAFGTVFGMVVGSFWAMAGGLFGLCAAVGAVLLADTVRRMLGGKGKLAEKLAAFLSAAPRLAARRRFLAACMASSALNWFLSMLQLWLLLHAFGAPASLVVVVAILPTATFAGLLPITVAGAGTRDAALLFLGAGLIDPQALLASSIIYTVLGYLLPGLAGLPFLSALTEGHAEAPPARRRRRRVRRHEA